MPDTQWLELRRKGWYAVQDVPRPLRAALGKKRLIVSLNTRDLRVAQARRHDALIKSPASSRRRGRSSPATRWPTR